MPQEKHLSLQTPLSHSEGTPAGFHIQMLYGLLFLGLEPRAERPHVGLGLSLFSGASAAKIFLMILTTTHGCRTCLLHSSSQSQHGFFFRSSVIEIKVVLSHGGSII